MKNIKMSTAMAQAVSDGRKTQFRIEADFLDEEERLRTTDLLMRGQYDEAKTDWGLELPYEFGDTIQVVEEYEMCMSDSSEDELFEKETGAFLKIVDIEVEDISEASYEDVLAEGLPKDFKCGEDGLEIWEWLEDQYPKIDWGSNVFVFKFERIENG